MDTISQQQKDIMDLMKTIKELKQQNVEKDKKINMLEERVDQLEQYSRLNNVIVSGLPTKPRSYAKAVGSTSRDDPEEEASVEQQVIDFMEGKGIFINSDHIEACHHLPRREKKDTPGKKEPPAIILRFTNRKNKIQLMKLWRKLEGTNVYLNEHLTKKNATIARQLRILRRAGKIQSTWTQNCKIFIKLNGTPEEAKTYVIKDLAELDKYQ